MKNEEYDPWESNIYGIPVYREGSIFPGAAPITLKKFAVQVEIPDTKLGRRNLRYLKRLGAAARQQAEARALEVLLNGQRHR